MVPSRSNTARPPLFKAAPSGGAALARELAQHERQDAAVAEIFALLGRVDTHAHFEADRAAAGRRGDDDGAAGVDAVEAGDLVALAASQAERLAVATVDELQRQHAHADQVGAMDTLEALGDHGAHAQQQGTLRRPVARRAGAVLLA